MSNDTREALAAKLREARGRSLDGDHQEARDLMSDVVAALTEQPAPQGVQVEPVAWIRFRSDGCYEGPVMNARMDEVRKLSGAWTPLYAAAPAAPSLPREIVKGRCWTDALEAAKKLLGEGR